MPHDDIRIGTLVGGNADTVRYITNILPHGFESFSITFWQQLGGVELPKLAEQVRPLIAGKATISSLGVFGNPLGVKEIDQKTRDAWVAAIDHAKDFGCDLVAGFAGRVVDKPIQDSIPRFTEVFAPLLDRAAKKGVRLAFENCPMGGTWASGDWNIAINPDAWELMFAALPAAHLGLEWEPCHQMCQLIDPMPQIEAWGKRFFHIHGKDATVDRVRLARHGAYGKEPFCWHRTPGFGDSDWTAIISRLRMQGFKGAIDIEGWHDPIYRGDLEMTGQVFACEHLKHCRGGRFVPNP
jgi:sugar phosphate isomerase/epimerase